MRLTCSLGQLETIAILMEDAVLEAALRGHDDVEDPVVRLRALPEFGVGVTVIVAVPGLAVAELREVLLDRIGRTVVPPPRPPAVPGGLQNGLRATMRKTYA